MRKVDKWVSMFMLLYDVEYEGGENESEKICSKWIM